MAQATAADKAKLQHVTVPPGTVGPLAKNQSLPPMSSSTSAAAVVQAEEFLISKGWMLVGSGPKGSLWNDPLPKEKEGRRDAVKLSDKDGNEFTVKQWVCPTPNWMYGTDEAVYIQRTRDVEEHQKQNAAVAKVA